ncbi:MAG: dihydrofolate reductase [Lachnospiraceae bacterium]|nr:dihydrofolate reductase [Lachnospiraceae bacterium]
MNLIFSADRNWAIGFKNELLIRIPDDMKQFRAKTTGNVVVMGRKTLESFPNKKPLKDRVNIVISTKKDYKVEGATVVHSIEEALEELKKYPTDKVFIIGGGKIYKEFLPHCDTAYVTYIDHAYAADTFIPNLDKLRDEWEMVEESEENTYFDIEYYYRIYKRKYTK